MRFHRIDSGIRSPKHPAPAHTNRRLSGAFCKGKFSVNVFFFFGCAYLSTKPQICQQKGLIFIFFAILHKNRGQNSHKIIQISPTKTFDFSPWTLYNGGNSKKAVTKTVRQRCFQRVGVWCEPTVFLPQDPSLPSRNAENFRHFRPPALRDSACWSVKRQHSCNLSGTAG